MPDPATFLLAAQGALTTARGALTLVSQVQTIAKSSKNLELDEKIMQLKGSLMALSEEQLELRTENLQLKKALEEAIRRAELTKNLQRRHQLYWLPEDGPRSEGPYCSRCFDVNSLLVHVDVHRSSRTTVEPDGPSYVLTMCPECKRKARYTEDKGV